MTKSNIIVFPGSIPVDETVVLHEAVELPQREEKPGRNLVNVVEAAVTAVIGVCIITCTLAILAMV